jgi:hypothetical protein
MNRGDETESKLMYSVQVANLIKRKDTELVLTRKSDNSDNTNIQVVYFDIIGKESKDIIRSSGATKVSGSKGISSMHDGVGELKYPMILLKKIKKINI